MDYNGIIMRQFRLFCIFCLALTLLAAGCQKKSRQPEDQKKAEKTIEYKGTIAAVGNSLTEGYGLDESQAYPALLEKKLRKNGHYYKVINAGISGETSSGTLSRIRWILNLKPDIVILETGANDGLRGIDPELTKRNILETVLILKENNVVVVLAGMKMIQNMGQEYTKKFASIYPDIAKQHELVFFPFFLEDVAGSPLLNQADGIHPTAGGYEIIVEKIYPYVIKAVKTLKNHPHQKE
ncbi:Acylhydrolase family protein [Desulfonema limicola]|uniref:Acylhydrolase family protein n=2 Tax=Desulfonema limicola TaxID=45656 RepID=A0A975BA44_9BACT|nr:Acylhydrolase family protein [Desulfonema limicola]